MLRILRVVLIVALLGGLLPAAPASADVAFPPDNCQFVDPDNDPETPELYLICMPWWPSPVPPSKFDLVVFAHGYVAPDPYGSLEDVFKQLILPDGSTLPELATSMGYAFAMTTYSKNGLAVKEGLNDTVQLIKTIKGQYPDLVGHVYWIGASEGGLITTLAAEKRAPISGGLALCGPIGNFRSQINYWGDFRVLFDYFYKDVLPPSPIAIPDEVMQNWNTVYTPTIISLMMNPASLPATTQLLKTSRAPIDPADPSTAIATTIGILSYNVFATNEAIPELGGQPFDNKYKWYIGSDNDWALNKVVARFSADLAALMEISLNYQTSGRLRVPLVTMHTLGDPIVPYWHETLYNAKALFGGSAFKHLNIPIDRYGHCAFTAQEALAGFAILNYMVTGKLPAGAPSGLMPAAQSEYQTLVEKFRSQLTTP
jgi:pimeloyl-ACP methyl ester carboxylesterase